MPFRKCIPRRKECQILISDYLTIITTNQDTTPLFLDKEKVKKDEQADQITLLKAMLLQLGGTE